MRNWVIGALALAFVLSMSTVAIARCGDYYRYPYGTEKQKTKPGWTVLIGYGDRLHFLDGSQYRLCYVYVFTKDKRLAEFVYGFGSTNAFWNAIRSSIKHYTCAVVSSGKRIMRLEQSIATAIINHYRAVTRKRISKLDVMIDLHVPAHAYCLPKSSFGSIGP